jgi:hypothetical protein
MLVAGDAPEQWSPCQPGAPWRVLGSATCKTAHATLRGRWLHAVWHSARKVDAARTAVKPIIITRCRCSRQNLRQRHLCGTVPCVLGGGQMPPGTAKWSPSGVPLVYS